MVVDALRAFTLGYLIHHHYRSYLVHRLICCHEDHSMNRRYHQHLAVLSDEAVNENDYQVQIKILSSSLNAEGLMMILEKRHLAEVAYHACGDDADALSCSKCFIQRHKVGASDLSPTAIATAVLA